MTHCRACYIEDCCRCFDYSHCQYFCRFLTGVIIIKAVYRLCLKPKLGHACQLLLIPCWPLNIYKSIYHVKNIYSRLFCHKLYLVLSLQCDFNPPRATNSSTNFRRVILLPTTTPRRWSIYNVQSATPPHRYWITNPSVLRQTHLRFVRYFTRIATNRRQAMTYSH